MSAEAPSASAELVSDKRIDLVHSLPFIAIHIWAVVGVIWAGWSWGGFGLALALFFGRMFGITAGFHRYFSHRSYKMGRVMQFLMAFLGTMSTQKGVLWWASHHRHHHKVSDEPGDIHSVRQDGFVHSHVAWILTRQHHATNFDRIKDFAKYPELRFLNTYHLLPTLVLVAVLGAVGGYQAILWGYAVSTVMLWHGTFTINSLSHVYGTRRYPTTDDSKNNVLLALLTMGEGWHNNHHYYQRATNQGFYWWEIDMTFYILKVMSWLRLVSDLHTPPERVRAWRGALADVPRDVSKVVPVDSSASAAPIVTAAAQAVTHAAAQVASPQPDVAA